MKNFNCYLRLEILLSLIFIFLCCQAEQRKQIMLSKGWLFSRDSISWQKVSIPHDWAIFEAFDKTIDMQVDTIKDSGELLYRTGTTGSLPWTGKGYYKTTITLDETPEEAEIFFDGAMRGAKVKINGNFAGGWPYGYNAFRINATKFLKKGDNLLEVSLENLDNSSRWYPGGGIYRPVRLVITGKTHLDPWQGWFYTLKADSTSSKLSLGAKVEGIEDINNLKVEFILLDEGGQKVAIEEEKVENDGFVKKEIDFANPRLWSTETPYLYTLVTNLLQGNKIIDSSTQKVGIRFITIDKENGFSINGKKCKIKGVCLHHDLGPLGAQVNKGSIIRRVKILKEMGCNAIRSSHNMPSNMEVEVCDSMGMMLMAESFDAWSSPKCKNDYSLLFNDWAEKDLTSLILNLRSHPSIVMWSIGNEIPEQGTPKGFEISSRFQELCHELDPTRKVTQGLDRVDAALKSGVATLMDIPGFNYRLDKYSGAIENLPQGFLLGSETASTVSSRGVYFFPVEEGKNITHTNGQSSSYDIECCNWSNLPDDDFKIQDDNPWVIGQFVWTGFDYLGEPTPYEYYWPSRSSYFGICDLAGLPKDRYWLYRSQWREDSPTLHLLPHWTWPEREGKVTPVYCYTSYPSAELFVNGKSQGKKSFDKTSRLDRYRLRWNDVVYESGEIKVVAYDSLGREAAIKTIKTAGAPHHLELEADRDTISSFNDDLSFIRVMMKDSEGNLCPRANNQVNFKVTGSGAFKASCNGDATSLVPFNSTSMPLFNGEEVVILEAIEKGKATLIAESEGLPPSSIEITIE